MNSLILRKRIVFLTVTLTVGLVLPLTVGAVSPEQEYAPFLNRQGDPGYGGTPSSEGQPSYDNSSTGQPTKSPAEIEWEEQSQVMNTLMISGKKTGVEAIAEAYQVSPEEAKKKFKSAMEYFEKQGAEQSAKDDMLYYPEIGLEVAKSAGIASSLVLGIVIPAAGIIEAGTTSAALSNYALMQAGIAAMTFKVGALAAEYTAYATDKKPNMDVINQMNDYSAVIGTISNVLGNAASLVTNTVSTKVLDVVGSVMSAATDSGAEFIGKYAGTKTAGVDNSPEGGGKDAKIRDLHEQWEVSKDRRSWGPVRLPDTGWGCDDCQRYYRAIIQGKPRSAKFRWSSDNKARMYLNDQLMFGDFWKESYCTDRPCCEKCCDTPDNCVANLSQWYSLDTSQFREGQNLMMWEIYEEWGGEGFHAELEVVE